MLYELTLFGEYFNQQVINRWNYVSSGSPAPALGSFALATAFGLVRTGEPPEVPADTVMAALLPVLSSQMVFTSATVRAAADYDPTDFYEVPFLGGLPGEATGEALSPVMAFGFKTNRTRTDIRAATKRFAGVTEGNIGNGGVISNPSGLWTALNLIALRMSEVLSFDAGGAGITFTPVVVSKERVVLENGNVTRRYYPTLTQQLTHTAVGVQWTPYDTVRSQTSRQYGRGA